jgi:AcrR family transcriptional regulator
VKEAGGSRRERNKRDKVERIVAAAAKVFASPKGFAGATTQEIAQLADVGSGTLFSYISAKEDLLIMVFRADMERMMESALNVASAQRSVEKKFVTFFMQAVQYFERDIPTSRELTRHIIFVTDERRRSDVRSLMRTLLKKLVVLVDQGKAAGEIRAETSSIALAKNLFAAHYLFSQQWLNGFITRRQYERTLATSVALHIKGA